MKFTRKTFCALIPALALIAAPGLRADVTIRYQSEFKPAAALQPMMETLMKTMETATATSIQMKSNKGYTTAGNWTEIFDFVKGEVTLVDPAHKTFATFPVAQLADKMAGAMPQISSAQAESMQQAMASIKIKVDAKVTGKTADIQGVQAEERVVTLTMDLPMPAEMNQSGPSMKMVMHIWTAKKEEALRVPAIRELTGYQTWQRYMVNPMGMFEKLSVKMPAMSKIVSPLIEEMFKNQSVILRTRIEIYMPFLATLASQMAAQGKSLPFALDPNAPLMEMDQEVSELSSAPVDASLFDVPKDYTAVPVEDMVRDMMKAHGAAAAVTPKPDAVK